MSKTKSCGCLRKENANKLQKGIASFNVLYSTYQRNANKRDINFNLTKDTFKNIVTQNCFYCGAEPSNVIKNKYNGDYIYNGIDRVDSSGGYFINNVVPCCSLCNQFKWSQGAEDFLTWVEQVYNHSVKRKGEK